MRQPVNPERPAPVQRSTLDELRAFDDDGTILGELIDIYLQDTPQRMLAIAEGLKAQDPQAVMENAHTLKSSCAQLGAMMLSELFKELESMGRDDRVDGGDRLLAHAEREFVAVREALIWERGAVS